MESKNKAALYLFMISSGCEHDDAEDLVKKYYDGDIYLHYDHISKMALISDIPLSPYDRLPDSSSPPMFPSGIKPWHFICRNCKMHFVKDSCPDDCRVKKRRTSL